MNKFISYEKLSKKKQKEINCSHRNTWDVNPISKVKESKKNI